MAKILFVPIYYVLVHFFYHAKYLNFIALDNALKKLLLKVREKKIEKKPMLKIAKFIFYLFSCLIKKVDSFIKYTYASVMFLKK